MPRGRHASPTTPSYGIVAAVIVAVIGSGIAVAATRATSAAPTRPATATSVLFDDDFHGPDGLVTNEYAAEHPGAGVTSSSWMVTSGSLFRRGDLGWSGVPDSSAPGPRSSTATNSDVFRMVTQRADFGNVRVHVEFQIVGFDNRGPRDSFDGLHVFLRYQSPQSLLVASICRRDNGIAIKKKVEGGPSNGGSYYTLASASNGCAPRQWHSADIDIRNAGDSVDIDLSIDGQHVLSARDSGQGGPPLLRPGRVGIRGDYVQFLLRRFTVRRLSS